MVLAELIIFFLEAANAVRARGTGNSGRTDGRESYNNLQISKIYVQFSRALVHQHYLEND
jgi:hypothetical protein